MPAATVALFYPGQSSYEWLRSKAHKGAAKVAKGEPASPATTATRKKRTWATKLVKAGPLEPMPVTGKNGYKELKVQAAYDDKNAYLRFQWKTDNAYPGTEHQYLRFDGKEWKVYGYPKLDKVVQEGKQPGIYEDRMSIMIDDGKVPGFAQQGCWLTCHDGERDMPKQFTKDEVAANALLTAIKKNDVRKYLPETRTNPLDWKTGKSVEEIAKIKAAGDFVDLIQWRAHRSQPGRHGRRRLRARVAQLRRRQGHVRRQRRLGRPTSRSSCGTTRRSATSRSPPTSCARATTS